MKRPLLFLLALVLLLSACTSREAVRRAVKEDPSLVLDVLRENKLLVLDIVQQALADQDRLAQEQQWRAELAHPFQPVIDGNRLVRGEAGAPISVVEYSDFFCPYCDRGSRTVKELMQRHPEEIKLIFKHYPLHAGAERLAGLFEAAALQRPDAAWKFKDEVFAAQRAIQQEGPQGKTLAAILDGLGIDVARAWKDAGSPEILKRIEADAAEARSFGFRGTPMFVVGGVAVRGAAPLDEFEKVLELVRQDRDGATDCKACGKTK